ncbi:putative SUA5 family translation factor [Candidatus Azobacteroides pseudotrichonymphae genomovar. CFP2]|uniref:L-threonylcarbamoyladenylate synthase n=1 Tax=Azobacteroides pseudotrichonymphae genomovar. CFP2 TaxID=511995 RepID=B6YRN8_AZOPC|nr:putative SUA5 family translation factor [Candidatus Azobacteroides pseudotrichonymphae genomovar. CFP2]
MIQKEIAKTCEILRNGGIVLYPTDTIWGLGCDASNEEAVERIFFIKKRPNTRTMLILLDSFDELHNYVENLPEITPDLIDIFHKKPLTIIYSGAKNVAPNLIASDGTLGIRITKDFFSKQLCFQLKNPLVSTSANISGQATPTTFSEISNEIIESVDYVVNYKRNIIQSAKPSSIIQIENGNSIKVIRK